MNNINKTTNNFFVVENNREAGKRQFLIDYINKLLQKFGFWHRLTPILNPAINMNSLEQRINFYHLISNLVEHEIDGELVELGSFTGQCAVLFQKILDAHGSKKELHLYDSFQVTFTIENSIEDELLNNFEKNKLALPIIHRGVFKDTLPTELPEKICFAHIDCGFGGDKFEHKEMVLYCLQHLYPRLSKGGICVLMDYHDTASIDPGLDVNPGVKLATDEFLEDKPEDLILLFGNEVSHAYFKKL